MEDRPRNTKRALDRDATSSLAMTVEGQVNTYILKRLDIAEQFYAQALQSNPNDSLAWLLKGTLQRFVTKARKLCGTRATHSSSRRLIR